MTIEIGTTIRREGDVGAGYRMVIIGVVTMIDNDFCLVEYLSLRVEHYLYPERGRNLPIEKGYVDWFDIAECHKYNQGTT